MRVPRSIRRLGDPFITPIRVPVLAGVNRGRWWSLVSAGGYVTGRRARREMELLVQLIRPGDTVWDVGAHHGAMTLCAAAQAGPGGRVVAFEPGARSRDVLSRHVRWNRCANVAVLPFALSNQDGEDRLGGPGTSTAFALGRGEEVVAVRTARSLVEQGLAPAPTFMKLDVEGAEGDALAGALDVIPRTARIFVEIHTPDNDRRCTASLLEAGFLLTPSASLVRMRAGDPSAAAWNIYCAGPGWAGRDQDLATLRAAGF